MRRHHHLRPTLLDRVICWFHHDERRQAWLAFGILVALWLIGSLIVGDDPST